MPRGFVTGTGQAQRSYSPAVITRGGRLVWLAGAGGATDDQGNSLAGNFDAQARQAFRNIEATLKQAGGSLKDIVTMTVFTLDVRHGDRFVELRKQFFPDGGYPGSALITVAGFARPEMLIEIQAIAVIGDE